MLRRCAYYAIQYQRLPIQVIPAVLIQARLIKLFVEVLQALDIIRAHGERQYKRNLRHIGTLLQKLVPGFHQLQVGAPQGQRAVGAIEEDHIDARIGEQLALAADNPRIQRTVVAVNRLAPVLCAMDGAKLPFTGLEFGNVIERAVLSVHEVVTVIPVPEEHANGLFLVDRAFCSLIGGKDTAEKIRTRPSIALQVLNLAHIRNIFLIFRFSLLNFIRASLLCRKLNPLEGAGVIAKLDNNIMLSGNLPGKCGNHFLVNCVYTVVAIVNVEFSNRVALQVIQVNLQRSVLTAAPVIERFNAFGFKQAVVPVVAGVVSLDRERTPVAVAKVHIAENHHAAFAADLHGAVAVRLVGNAFVISGVVGFIGKIIFLAKVLFFSAIRRKVGIRRKLRELAIGAAELIHA